MAKARSYKRYVFVLLLIAIFAVYWLVIRSDAQRSPIFTTTQLTKGDISQDITASGSLEPVTSIEVGSQVSGLITEVLVDFNSPVTKGQLIAKIDPASYDQRLRQSEAELASAVASHTLVGLNTTRTRDLRMRNLVTQQELDQAEAALAQASAALQIRQASVENAKVDLSRCFIYAPVNGIVLDRKIDVGKTVAASLNAPTLFVIAEDLEKMQINAAISEADIGAVLEGQLANFTVDAFPNREYGGRVVQIRNSPAIQSNVVTYETIIAVRNVDKTLKPGMTANVSVIIASRNDIFRIANSALRVRMPKSLLPIVESDFTKPASASSEEPQQATREQFMKLMQDAGFERGAGPPSAEVRARLVALAKERGIKLPERSARGGRGNQASSAPAEETTRTVFKLAGTAEKPEVIPVTVKLGITDGSATEVIQGLTEDDVIITSALIPDGGADAKATTNPFASNMRRGR